VLVWLIVRASLHSDGMGITSVAIYGASLVLLYAISTSYHSVRGRASGCCASWTT
jgi:hemolysin III